MIRFLLSIIFLPLLLSGCISLASKPPQALLTLTPQTRLEAGSVRSGDAGNAIMLATPRVSAALASNRIPVQSGDSQIAYVKDGYWVDAPAKLVRVLLAEAVSVKTGRLVVDPRQVSFEPALKITAELRRFGVDADAMEAVIVIDVLRIGRSGIAAQERRFEKRVPLAKIEAEPVAGALNTAANFVASQIAEWIAA